MRKFEPIEIVLITVPVLCELVAVGLFIAAIAVGYMVINVPVPA